VSSALAKRYAKALLALAEENREVGRIQTDLEQFCEAWKTSGELRELFSNPGFGMELRRKVVDELSQRMNFSSLLKNTLRLLTDRRRIRHIPAIADAFFTMSEEKAGRVHAEVISATPMPESYLQELQKVLENVTSRKVVLEHREDPSLIAGIVTRVGDKVFDGSLRSRLSSLREQLLNTAVPELRHD
jgi:F-type H+-transporting ATPase subunit delta